MGMHAQGVRGFVPIEHPGLPPERSVAMKIYLVGGANPVAKTALQLSSAEMDDLKSIEVFYWRRRSIRPSVSPWGAPVLFAPQNLWRPADVPELPCTS
jgi:hypothetical protein